MRFRAKTLEDVQDELWIYSPSTDPKIKPLSLFHYTSNDSKSKIVDEETGSVNFRLTMTADFLDKNEGIYILEPYYHACGYLYDNNIIDFDFYSILKSIKPSDIADEAKDLWILCLTAEGYSKYMKERYAPNDGWQIELTAMSFEDLVFDFNSCDNSPNYVYLAEIQYSYKMMKKQIQKAIKRIYNFYKSDNSVLENEKRIIVVQSVIAYLTKYNFCYKSSSYKEEKEIRLICHIEKPFIRWNSKDNPGTYLYFEDNRLYLHFEQDCYRQSMQQPNIYNSIEINKSITTSLEIRETVKKRSKEFSK